MLLSDSMKTKFQDTNQRIARNESEIELATKPTSRAKTVLEEGFSTGKNWISCELKG